MIPLTGKRERNTVRMKTQGTGDTKTAGSRRERTAVDRNVSPACLLFICLAALPLTTVSAEKRVPSAAFPEIRMGLAHVGVIRTRGELVATMWLGTGFVIDRECTLVTAAHIFENAHEESLVVRFLHPDDPDAVRTFNVVIDRTDPERDMALLRLKPGQMERKFCRNELIPIPPIERFEPRNLTGEPVLVAGFPVLEGRQPRDVPILRKGIIASSELEWEKEAMLLLDLSGVPGFSGAPVILERTGQVVGIVFGPGRTSREYDFEWATPISGEIVRRLIQRSDQDKSKLSP